MTTLNKIDTKKLKHQAIFKKDCPKNLTDCQIRNLRNAIRSSGFDESSLSDGWVGAIGFSSDSNGGSLIDNEGELAETLDWCVIDHE